MSSFEHAIKEMRGRDRVEVSEVIHVVNTQTGETMGRLVNISEEGFMLLGTAPIDEDNIFQLSLEFENDAENNGPIRIGVESLWCHASSDKSQYWSGFYIIDISDEDLQRVRQITS